MLKNFLATMVGLIVAVLLFLGINFVGARLHSPSAYLNQLSFLKFDPTVWAQVFEKSDLQISEVEIDDNVNAHFDKQMRRITGSEESDAKKFALFLGCSFAFGDGLQDNETLPYHFHQKNKDYRTYNYGIPGGGVHTSLRRVMTRSLADEVAEEEGLVFYNVIWGHIGRASYSLDSTSFGYDYPRFDIVDGEVVYQGNQIEASPLFGRLWKVLGSLHYINFNSHLLEPAKDPEKIEKFLLMVAKLKEEVLKAKPKARFIVMVYPGENRRFEVVKKLENQGIEVWDLSLKGYPEGISRQEGDNHPSSDMNQHLAEMLHNRLEYLKN